jgi:hypothetical protein
VTATTDTERPSPLPSVHQPSLLDRIDAAFGRRVSMRALALLRVFAGPIAVLHLAPFLVDTLHGRIYRDTFYEPYAAWYPELPRSVYVALLWVGAAAALAMTIGLCTRLATIITLGVMTYNLFLSTTNMHNNRAYLVIVLAALAVVPCGRELSADAWLRRRRGLPPLDPTAPAWPLLLLRFEASTVYVASGLSKLLDPDWFGGTVTWLRMVHVQGQLSASVLPKWMVDLLLDRSFHVAAAKVIILTELFIGIGLWSRRTREAAVWVAVCFHLAIQLSARVEVFSFLAVAALVIWAAPSTRDRVLIVGDDGRGRRWIRAALAFDWLARFRLETAPPGEPVRVLDRDGRVMSGRAAAAFAFSRFPATAWFALPVAAFTGREGRST